jgi:uncharacterized protein with HEPN domain
MERDARAYLWDVQQAAEAIGQFSAGLDVDGYARNALVRAAVERQIRDYRRGAEPTREACARGRPARAASARHHRLIHGYATIDHARVWRIAETVLPGLQQTVSELLAELGPPDA